MSETIIKIWAWFPVYFIFPLAVYFNYLITRNNGSLDEKKSILYALNPFSSIKVKKLNNKERIVSWILVFSIGLWFILGIIMKKIENL